MKHTNPLEAMKADAAACNAAMRRKMGVGAQGYTRRKPTTDAGTMQSLVLAAATDEPQTTSQLAKKAGTTIDATRKAVQRLAKRGQLVQAETVFIPQSGGRAKTYRRAQA